jgi:protein-S-isoprenylcysteine O-methyltransferase Ste14
VKTETTHDDDATRKTKILLELLGWIGTVVVCCVVLFYANWSDKIAICILKAIGLLFMLIASIIGIVCCFSDNRIDLREQEVEQEHKLPWKEIRHFFLTGFLVIDVIMILVLKEFLLDSDAVAKLWQAKIEWIVALGIAIGILGAVWAVLAKIDASRAFEQASQARYYTLKTYNSIAGAFKFREILKPNSDFMLPFHLEREHSALILFLGFPAVGFFHRGNNTPKEPDLLPLALKFCNDLTTKLSSLQYDGNFPFIRLVLFSKELTKHYLEKAVTENTITNDQKAEFERVEGHLHEAIQELKSKNRNFKCAVDLPPNVVPMQS